MSEDDWLQDDWNADDFERYEIIEDNEVKPPPKILVHEPPVVKIVEVAESKPAQLSINDQILLGVDNGLDAFGKNVKEVFYAEMESSKQLKRGEILDNMEQFHVMIEQFFGVGSPLVERCMGREILCIFKLPSEAGLNFKTAVAIVRRHPSKL